jgi:Rap1a immunity proteins
MRRALMFVLATLGGTAVALAATVQDFQVKTAADMVALCDASPDSEYYVAAVHFCQGYAIGAWQYYQAQTVDDPSSQFVCIPNPPPTRNDAIAAFVVWAKAHPQFMDHAAVDTMFRYLGETYPCKR